MSHINGLPGFDAWLTREPEQEFPDKNDGRFCDLCWERYELEPVYDHVFFDGERVGLCEECLERGRAP